MDMKTAFLNDDFKKEIYMDQPEGFIAKGQENKVCKLVKSLYGLKQAQNNGIRNSTKLLHNLDSLSMNMTSAYILITLTIRFKTASYRPRIHIMMLLDFIRVL